MTAGRSPHPGLIVSVIAEVGLTFWLLVVGVLAAALGTGDATAPPSVHALIMGGRGRRPRGGGCGARGRDGRRLG